jgi:hypothetical protein
MIHNCLECGIQFDCDKQNEFGPSNCSCAMWAVLCNCPNKPWDSEWDIIEIPIVKPILNDDYELILADKSTDILEIIIPE